jgi:uncharacterized OB-fold protein
MGGARFDQPFVEPESAPFWQGLKDGRLLVRRCGHCDVLHFYPRPFCPFCWSDDVEWHEVSGRARVYSYSTVYVISLRSESRFRTLPPWSSSKRVPA